MDSADAWIENYESLLEGRIQPMFEAQDIAASKINRIKVAILDTGIDWKDPYILGARDRITEYRNFVKDREDCSDKQNVDDDFGHGTHATALLLKTSLNTDICVARVAKDGQLDNPNNIADVSFRSQILEWVLMGNRRSGGRPTCGRST
jgi:subtilisin family serine protease